MKALTAPLLQTYDTPPPAVSVTPEPLHIAIVAGKMVATGDAFTVTVRDAAAAHPFELVAVTEYVVDAGGETLIPAEVAPTFQM